MRMPGKFAAAALVAVAFPAAAHRGTEPPVALEFEPPAAGTYALPPIQAVPGGEVIDTSGRSHAFGDYTRGRITLLGLVYTRCGDPQGCPRATWAFSAVRRLLREDPGLQGQVRLVTLSFDPVHDDFKTIGAYSQRMGGKRAGAEWHFLTTRSRPSLAPILEGLGQDLRVAAGSNAVPGTEEFTHSLKVFLIDREARVREIYSTGYLMPQMMVNDIRTLALELTRSR
jgi:protein SCO1